MGEHGIVRGNSPWGLYLVHGWGLLHPEEDPHIMPKAGTLQDPHWSSNSFTRRSSAVFQLW